VIEQAAEFIFGSWSTPEIQLTIEYPLEVLDEIRSSVCDGLQQLAHGGLEVGGVLFGVRRENTLRILTWRPISCEHAHGPSLRLSARDRIDLARLLEVAKADSDLAGLQPAGWFLSHARSDIFLSQADLEIFHAYFPEPWQVTLVLRPNKSGAVRAGFFLREADGSLRSESSYKDFVAEPLHNPGASGDVTGRRLRDLPMELSAPHNQAQSESTNDAVELTPVRIIEPPRFLTQKQRASGRGRWLWAIPGSLALIIAGMLLKERFLTRYNQPFSFRAYGSGPTAEIEWDANAASIQAARSASLDIKDGAEAHHYSLTPEQLKAGKMAYLRHAADLELRMTVYPADGASLQEYARVVGVATTPSDHATNDQPGSPDVTQLRTDRDRFEAEAKQLREELRKEKIRADQAQETLRILQNRIAVDAARGQGPDAKKQ
jgi:hypothetical protein